MDFTKYTTDKDELEFLGNIHIAVGIDSQSEVFLKYKDFPFFLEPHGRKIEVYSRGECLGIYQDIDDLFLNFMIDGKPFIERIADIDYD